MEETVESGGLNPLLNERGCAGATSHHKQEESSALDMSDNNVQAQITPDDEDRVAKITPSDESEGLHPLRTNGVCALAPEMVDQFRESSIEMKMILVNKTRSNQVETLRTVIMAVSEFNYAEHRFIQKLRLLNYHYRALLCCRMKQWRKYTLRKRKTDLCTLYPVAILSLYVRELNYVQMHAISWRFKLIATRIQTTETGYH